MEETQADDIFKEAKTSIEVLNKFDVNEDKKLDPQEFRTLCGVLFRKGNKPYKLDVGVLDTFFQTFDSNQDGFICLIEFETCWTLWILPIVSPVPVLVVVDVQHDFISGSLALKNAPAGEDGKDVIKPINKMLDTIKFKKVFYTKDWHPKDHISFINNVAKYPIDKSSPIQNPKDAKVLDTVIFTATDGHPIEQRLWPEHCVQGSPGAELDPDLTIVENHKVVCKGEQSEVDSYSAFLDNDRKSMTPLKGYIDEVGANDVYVCGLAYDYCVGGTALDSLDLGFRTILLEDAVRGVDLQGVESMKAKLLKAGGFITDTDKVKDMISGIDRRPELGLYLAKKLDAQNKKTIHQNNNQPSRKKLRAC